MIIIYGVNYMNFKNYIYIYLLHINENGIHLWKDGNKLFWHVPITIDATLAKQTAGNEVKLTTRRELNQPLP